MRAAFNRFVDRHEVAWELTMGTLAIAYLISGFASEGSDTSAAAMGTVETALTAVFVLEFGSGLAAAYDRIAYLRSHWLDLIALIPVIRQFRLLRLLRLLRLVRTFAGIYRALLHVERLLGNRQIATVAVVWLAILVLTSFGMFIAEQGVNDAVNSPLDALWWGVVTMTTVGYGDIYPITPEGRVAAAILMVLGIGLFGVITATATGLMVRHSESDGHSADPIAQLARLHELLTAGALTTDEFAATKDRLLSRVG
jgi:voltage-gated potassium channel